MMVAGVRGVGRALGGRWEGIGRASGGRREGVGRALGGRWRVVKVRPGSLIYSQIKSLHCSGYLLVFIYCDVLLTSVREKN